MNTFKKSIFIFVATVICGGGVEMVRAQTSQSAPYIPLIGITSVPDSFALPNGAGDVTYHYTVKNFLQEASLIEVQVVDDKCDPIKFLEGDDNGDGKLDYSEIWKYSCTTKLSTTTRSIATATGVANNITATHRAFTTVVVGSNNPPPLVSIVNITKIASPLSLPAQGGQITFTYKVNNPGVVPLSDVIVTDDKCSAMSGKLGDTNGNDLLDTNEVWIYTCVMDLKQTTMNTATVVAYANGLKATGNVSITVKIETPGFPKVGKVPEFPGQNISSFQVQNIPSFPETGVAPNFKIIVWGIMLDILIVLMLFFLVTRKKRQRPTKESIKKNFNFLGKK